MADKCLKMYSISLFVKQMKMKTTLRIHVTPAGKVVVERRGTTDAGEDTCGHVIWGSYHIGQCEYF